MINRLKEQLEKRKFKKEAMKAIAPLDLYLTNPQAIIDTLPQGDFAATKDTIKALILENLGYMDSDLSKRLKEGAPGLKVDIRDAKNLSEKYRNRLAEYALNMFLGISPENDTVTIKENGVKKDVEIMLNAEGLETITRLRAWIDTGRLIILE